MFPLTHSISFHLNLPFNALNLSNKGMKEYYKIILSIHFHFIPFSPPKLMYR